MEIGDWNMVADQTWTLLDTIIPDVTKIRSLSAIIRDDTNNSFDDFATAADSGAAEDNVKQLRIATTLITMTRDNGGPFDYIDYDSTSYNRGWITIQYEV